VGASGSDGEVQVWDEGPLQPAQDDDRCAARRTTRMKTRSDEASELRSTSTSKSDLRF
jgi:hypothetical protein